MEQILENPINIFFNLEISKLFKEFISDYNEKFKIKEPENINTNILDENKKFLIEILNEEKIIQYITLNQDVYIFEKTPYFNLENISTINLILVSLNLNIITKKQLLLKFIIKLKGEGNINNKQFKFKILDSIPNSKNNSEIIFLPPIIENENIPIPIKKEYIYKFNKKFPNILDKEIFSNENNLNNFINLISKNFRINFKNLKDKKDKIILENINLITNIFFSPHPLKNFFNKFSSKNNTIKYENSEFNIIDLSFNKVDIEPPIIEENKKIYTQNVTLTVINSSQPVNLT